MKFSHSLQFNAVPDWSSYYIAYSNLKKLIYSLEKEVHARSPVAAAHGEGDENRDAESSPLLGGAQGEDVEKAFVGALDTELEKICGFYRLKELEIYGEMDSALKDEAEYEAETHTLEDAVDGHTGTGQPHLPPPSRRSVTGRPRSGSMFKAFAWGGPGHRRRTSTLSSTREDEDSDEEEVRAPLVKAKSVSGTAMDRSVEDFRSVGRKRTGSLAFDDYNDMSFSALYDSGITLKKRIIGVYVSLCELRSFIQLNRTGFSKVLKKFDKILDRNLKREYIEEHVLTAYPFQQRTMDHLNTNIGKMEHTYAELVTQGKEDEARRELRLHLREHVVWERNTVWREMIGIERKAQAANMGIRGTMLGGETDPSRARLQGDEAVVQMREIRTRLGTLKVPEWLISPSLYTLVGAIVVLLVLLFMPIMSDPAEQNCLAMVVFVSMLWATEAIPLFVTSLLVPFLVVILRVVKEPEKPHRRMTSESATKFIFSAMWSQVIMLLLGGFTIAAALSKYSIAKIMATFVLSKAGTRPRTVLLTTMFVATFASMWISNVAAPILCYSIIQPILRNLPPDSAMTKALILGIALASNIGGAASPIASPQNVIALLYMNPQPGWGTWFFVALPVCIITILLIWLLLLISLHPSRGTTIVPIRQMRDRFTGIQWFISIVTLATIALWCVSHSLDWLFGDMGVIAIIPIVLFFGTGILTKEDFNNFLWTIIILAAGGMALGTAVSSSGLLHTLAQSITTRVEHLSLYGVLVTFAAIILIVATFISHTVAALIFLPLVQSVGKGMAQPHPNLLVMGSVLMCSAAMGLPTSGFPNMTAIMMEDSQTGMRYLRVKHFITRGVPASIITFLVVITVGYGLMLLAAL